MWLSSRGFANLDKHEIILPSHNIMWYKLINPAVFVMQHDRF